MFWTSVVEGTLTFHRNFSKSASHMRVPIKPHLFVPVILRHSSFSQSTWCLTPQQSHNKGQRNHHVEPSEKMAGESRKNAARFAYPLPSKCQHWAAVPRPLPMPPNRWNLGVFTNFPTNCGEIKKNFTAAVSWHWMIVEWEIPVGLRTVNLNGGTWRWACTYTLGFGSKKDPHFLYSSKLAWSLHFFWPCQGFLFAWHLFVPDSIPYTLPCNCPHYYSHC